MAEARIRRSDPLRGERMYAKLRRGYEMHGLPVPPEWRELSRWERGIWHQLAGEVAP